MQKVVTGVTDSVNTVSQVSTEMASGKNESNTASCIFFFFLS